MKKKLNPLVRNQLSAKQKEGLRLLTKSGDLEKLVTGLKLKRNQSK